MTAPRRRWVERSFELDVPIEAFPDLLMRVRGTPARLEELVRSIPSDRWTAAYGGAWSIQRNVGHLIDLEVLWMSRVRDFATAQDRLTAWDVENRATRDTDWDGRAMESALAEFRTTRERLVRELEGLGIEALERASMHPRLVVPVTPAGLALFVAEHDDHHLVTIDRLGSS